MMVSAPELADEAARRIRAAGQRLTPLRTQVLQALLAREQPVTHTEIQQQILDQGGTAMDRVTLYRNLDWLVQHELAHRITADDRVWRFSAIRPEHPSHPHFHCLRCGQVQCLEDAPVVAPSLPADYSIQDVELVVNGICPYCRKTPGDTI